jgi:hypothetical protein
LVTVTVGPFKGAATVVTSTVSVVWTVMVEPDGVVSVTVTGTVTAPVLVGSGISSVVVTETVLECVEVGLLRTGTVSMVVTVEPPVV